MTRPLTLLGSPSGGGIELTRIGVRRADASSAGVARGARSFQHEPWRGGTQRIGAFELAADVHAGECVARVDVRARNVADVPVLLDAVVLGLRWRGAATQSSLRFLRHGWQSWSVCTAHGFDPRGDAPFPSGPWLRGMFHALGETPADRAGWHESELVTAVGASPGGAVCVAGVLERGRGFGLVYARQDGDDVLVEIEVWSECLLAPGEERAMEPVRVALGSDVSRLLDEHAAEHGREASARTRAPFQAGWCSWYHFFHDVSAEDVMRNLDALAAARDELGIGLVQLDDGYQRAIGDWLETNAKFPRGLAPIAGAIRSAGFAAGLWTAPFCVTTDSRAFEDHRAWLLRDGDAPFRGLHHGTWTKEGWVHVLDASRDDVLDHLRETFSELVGMGFSYQKLDFLYTQGMQADAADPRIGRAERLRRGLEAIRAGCGEEAFLLGCGCPLGAAVGVVDGMRIGPDVAPAWLPEAPEIPGIQETRPSTRNAVRNVLARSWMHRRLWLNDPDCLMSRETRTALTSAESRTLAGAVAGTGGMVLFSDDVPALSAASRNLVARTVALARDVDAGAADAAPRVLGLLEDGFAHGAVAKLTRGWIATLVNASDARAFRGVEPADVGTTRSLAWAPLSAELTVDNNDSGGISVVLEPHASALLHVRPAPPLGVFCDFDGTFAVQDVGSTLAKRYAAERRPAAWARYERGEITAWEYNLEILHNLPVSEEALEAFLQTVELDPGARHLLGWCASHGVPFRILSDGFDRNLDRLQEIHAVSFAYDANRLSYAGGRWQIEAIHPNASCGCGTGICKRARIEEYRTRHPGDQVVHIGNGRVSDLCGALAADLAFAKGSLAEALSARGAPFEPFDTLDDVLVVLDRRWGLGAPYADS